jgi:hypothetical protein
MRRPFAAVFALIVLASSGAPTSRAFAQNVGQAASAASGSSAEAGAAVQGRGSTGVIAPVQISIPSLGLLGGLAPAPAPPVHDGTVAVPAVLIPVLTAPLVGEAAAESPVAADGVPAAGLLAASKPAPKVNGGAGRVKPSLAFEETMHKATLHREAQDEGQTLFDGRSVKPEGDGLLAFPPLTLVLRHPERVKFNGAAFLRMIESSDLRKNAKAGLAAQPPPAARAKSTRSLQSLFATAKHALQSFGHYVESTLRDYPRLYRKAATAAFVDAHPLVERMVRAFIRPDPAKDGVGSSAFSVRRWLGKGAVQRPSPIEEQTLELLAADDLLRSQAPRVLSEEELVRLMSGRASPSGTLGGRDGPDASLENFSRATRRVNDWVAAGADLDMAKILEINGILLSGTQNSHLAGVMRDLRVGHSKYYGFFFYAAPGSIPFYMRDFMDWYAAKKDTMTPIQLAALAYQQLVRVHPFIDANGRTTRLVMDFILQRNGYVPATFAGHFPEVVHSDSDSAVRSVRDGIWQALDVITAPEPAAAPPP